jgi:DEAD/DEAH box helicase domain-containing protein
MSVAPGSIGSVDADRVLQDLASGDHELCIAHLERLPAREVDIEHVDLAPELSLRLRRAGIEGLWSHQAAGLRATRVRENVAIATGTASGKSLVYQLATLERLIAEPNATAIYLFPTKALSQDQLRQLRSFAVPAARAAVYDGDTPSAERSWVRRNANVLITNPDMLHIGILPSHERWAMFFKELRLVVIDEMHTLRGVFGSHVANVIRRLRRIAAHYGSSPQFVTASATIGNPADLAERLTGLPFQAITEDGSPRGEKLFALWNPPFVETDQGGGARYSAGSQAAGLLAGLARENVRTIAFARTRKSAELIAHHARNLLEDHDARARIAAYRAGYLPEERRRLERELVDGSLVGVAATSALELGIDIGGLDACLIAGYPGTIAATWQQAGRAGRARQSSLAVLIAQDDPLDQYIVSHPEEIFGKPHEAAVIDPSNPNIGDQHLGCAAYELPLTDGDAAIFGATYYDAVARLDEAGLLKRRGDKRYWSGRTSPAPSVDIRAAGRVVSIVEQDTGSVLGTSEESRAPHTLHPGAIYLHQGEQFEVQALDLESCVAVVSSSDAAHYTQARDITDIRISATRECRQVGNVDLFFGDVVVSNQVVGYVRKRLYSNELIDEVPLDMPENVLRTKAVWYTVPPSVLKEARIAPPDVPGCAHAAEHAAIGLMPLFAMCDRWDIGGVSTAEHPDTGLCTVFIYDGYPGGAGFAARSFEAGAEHLRATLETIASCPCERGCPSCVQSPKCGNGNEPLDKMGAARLLAAILGEEVSIRVPRPTADRLAVRGSR